MRRGQVGSVRMSGVLLAAGRAPCLCLARRRAGRFLVMALVGWLSGGVSLGSRAERLAQAPPLRAAVLANSSTRPPAGDARDNGAPHESSPDRTRGPAVARASRSRYAGPTHDFDQIVTILGRLRQDAALLPQGVSLTIAVDELARAPTLALSDGVMLTVLGSLGAPRISDWRAGRRLRVQAMVREPARYLDPGVPDLPLSLARRGIAMVGSVKSGALVEVVGHGSWLQEHATPARHPTRQLTMTNVGSWDPTTAAIVTAILIGDRAGLDDRIERDLQEAGTYHVIAISGGNIAILAACLLLTCRLLFMRWRAGLAVTILVLLAYA